jgi:hypothetical protein
MHFVIYLVSTHKLTGAVWLLSVQKDWTTTAAWMDTLPSSLLRTTSIRDEHTENETTSPLSFVSILN